MLFQITDYLSNSAPPAKRNMPICQNLVVSSSFLSLKGPTGDDFILYM